MKKLIIITIYKNTKNIILITIYKKNKKDNK